MERRRQCRSWSDATHADTLAGSLSTDAVRLHLFAVLASIEADHAGFVTDDYLGCVHADTVLPVLELCSAGIWSRAEGGYRVPEDETMRMATEVHRQLEQLSTRCRSTGGHAADPEHPDVCRACGVQLS